VPLYSVAADVIAHLRSRARDRPVRAGLGGQPVLRRAGSSVIERRPWRSARIKWPITQKFSKRGNKMEDGCITEPYGHDATTAAGRIHVDHDLLCACAHGAASGRQAGT
jgi:hypothetical protein